MTQGFDEWYRESKKINDDGFSSKDFYEAGAASRQAEIDELKHELEILQGMHNAVSLTAGELIDERDKLQKRIDKAMNYVSESPLKDVSRRAMLNFLDILKGDSNE